MQDILAPEDHNQGTISKDRPARHHHGNICKEDGGGLGMLSGKTEIV